LLLFGVVVFLFLVGFALFGSGRHLVLLSPILQHLGIANQRQYVLMTVRASSVHGMSSKKKPSWAGAVRTGELHCFDFWESWLAINSPLFLDLL